MINVSIADIIHGIACPARIQIGKALDSGNHLSITRSPIEDLLLAFGVACELRQKLPATSEIDKLSREFCSSGLDHPWGSICLTGLLGNIEKLYGSSFSVHITESQVLPVDCYRFRCGPLLKVDNNGGSRSGLITYTDTTYPTLIHHIPIEAIYYSACGPWVDRVDVFLVESRNGRTRHVEVDPKKARTTLEQFYVPIHTSPYPRVGVPCRSCPTQISIECRKTYK